MAGYPRVIVKWSNEIKRWRARCPHPGCSKRFKGADEHASRGDVEQLVLEHGEGHHGWGK